MVQLLILNFIDFLNDKLVTVHHVLCFFVALGVLNVVEVDGFRTISVAVKQTVEVKAILAVLDNVVLLLLLNFLDQAHANEFPPLGCALGELVVPRG